MIFPQQKRRRSAAPTIIGVLVVALIIIGAIWFDFYVWRLQHPQAPTWTFIFKP